MENNSNNIMNSQTERMTQPNQVRRCEQKEVDPKPSKRLGIITLSLFLGSILVMVSTVFLYFLLCGLFLENEAVFFAIMVILGGIFVLGGLTYLASFVLMIILRVYDKKNVIGLILMMIHIFIFVVIVVCIIISVIMAGVVGCTLYVIERLVYETFKNCPG